MFRHYPLAFSLTILCSLPMSVSASPHVMAVPPDSFINQHVDSVAQLRQQVTLDPVVRRRLARHFHLSGPAMVRYIQDNLVLKKTTRTQRYHVYCISRTGREYVINARLPLGTPVFVMRSTGKPILKLACGNPMVATLPSVESRKVLAPPKMASLPQQQAAAKLAPGLLPNGPVITAANFGPGVYITTPTVTKISPYISGILPKGGGSSLGYLAGIPLLYGIINHGGGTNTGGTIPGGTNTGGTNTGGTSTGGTSTGGTNTGGTNNTGGSNTGGSSTGGTNTGETNTGETNTGGNNTGPSPVPEPGSPVAFAIGGAGLALLAGARRRWRK
ncbi:MAG: PEP-CTERM sorting domain-containing protein [Armatimonadota bacterium]|nr:PEP-CTERM sorting domain-containing protein [Armatimonadota bacterium]